MSTRMSIKMDLKRNKMIEQDKIIYIRKAIKLGSQGEGFMSPNPLVGSVIVKDSFKGE